MASSGLKLLSLTIAAIVSLAAVYYAVNEFQKVVPDTEDSSSMRILRVNPDPKSVVLERPIVMTNLPVFAAALDEAGREGESTLHGRSLCHEIRSFVNAQTGDDDVFEQRIAYNGTHFRLLYVTV